MKTNKNNKRFMIISICILCIVVIGSTYALYKTVLFNDLNVDGATLGLDYYINYSKGQDITSSTLNQGSDYTSGNSADIELWKKNEDYNIYGHIYLDITSIGDNLKNSNALKYAILNNNEVIAEGSLRGNSTGSSVLIKSNIKLLSSKQIYKVYIWLDENNIDNYAIEDENLSITVRCEATMKPIKFASSLISNLYSPNTTAVNNSITYNLDNKNYLMEDNDGNLRYYGKTPNNYIYFNCDTYPSTNCEKWRIIGVFDNKLKIIRDESIGQYSWDTSPTTVNGGRGINEWSKSDLMKLLNPGYDDNKDLNSSEEEITINNSLYWNSGSGTCYNGQSNATTTCNFTSTGLKNDTTRNKIANSLWYLGGWDWDTKIYTNQAYAYERGATVVIPGTTCSGTYCNDTITRTTRWTGKIGFIYSSDYGYATDLSQCNHTLNDYNDASCTSTNWLYNSNYQWTLTPDSSVTYITLFVNISGYVSTSHDCSARGVRPTLYLKADTVIVSGDGSEEKPYTIS